jgi:hypothetical protein
MNPQTRILDIETMALGIVDACKSLKILRHPVHPCEENGCTDWQGCDEICIYHPDFQKAAQAIHDTKILKEIDAKCKTASENTNVTEIKLAFDMVRLWIKELRERECNEVKDNAKDS